MAQRKYFELNNPEALLIEKEMFLSSKKDFWKVEEMSLHKREGSWAYSSRRWLRYFKNGDFSFKGVKGKWELIENKYVKHTFDNEGDDKKFNFGGIYAIIHFSDSTLMFSKVLSSKNDLKFNYLLKKTAISKLPPAYVAKVPKSNSTINQTKKNNKDKNTNYFPGYTGVVNEHTIDSLSRLSMVDIFVSGYKV